MKIPSVINFSNVLSKKTFSSGSQEYKALAQLDNEGKWKDYCNEMISRGLIVRFDVNSDEFVVTPEGLNEEVMLLKDDEEELDIDIESGDAELSDVVDRTYEHKNNQSQMQVVSLDDVMAILNNMGITSNKKVATDISASIPAPVTNSSLQGGDDALKQTYFQAEGNEILDSEFTENSEDIAKFQQSATSEAPLPTVEPVPDQTAVSAKTDKYGGMVYGGTTTYDDMDGGYEANPDIARLNGEVDLFTDEEPEVEITEPVDGAASVETTGEEELLLDDEEQIDEDFNYDDEMEVPEGMNRDLARIAGPMAPAEEEEEFEVDSFDAGDYAFEEEEPAVPSVTVNKTMQCCGMPVQIVLTGVMITPKEINYIGESVKAAGNKLKAIKGEDNQIQIVLEADNKKYIINYIDLPKIQNPTPFSIKEHKFTSLEEALGRINRKSFLKESNVFKQIVGEDLTNRQLNEFKEANIFDDYKEAGYVSSWTVSPVGMLNLKNGLNEVYSNVTQHGKESNTLVKTNENYFLIKGNLKERSKVGTTREIVDAKGKSYGIAKVIGIYENTSKGLGQIMFDIKRTTIPMLVWK